MICWFGCRFRLKINMLILSARRLANQRLWFFLWLLLDLSLYILLSILSEIISKPYFHKGHPFKLCCPSRRCHTTHINTNIPHNLGEKHSIRDMILLHFGVESVFEDLHLVVENDSRKIHRPPTITLYIQSLSFPLTQFLDPNMGMTMLNRKLWISLDI